MFEGFTKETRDFLWELSFHNERPWFNEHKEQYLRVLHDPFHALAEDCRAIMAENYPFSDFSLRRRRRGRAKCTKCTAGERTAIGTIHNNV